MESLLTIVNTIFYTCSFSAHLTSLSYITWHCINPVQSRRYRRVNFKSTEVCHPSTTPARPFVGQLSQDCPKQMFSHVWTSWNIWKALSGIQKHAGLECAAGILMPRQELKDELQQVAGNCPEVMLRTPGRAMLHQGAGIWWFWCSGFGRAGHCDHWPGLRPLHTLDVQSSWPFPQHVQRKIQDHPGDGYRTRQATVVRACNRVQR